MKKGLILEGGAMRGLFTAGVIDVLMENDIKFDGAIGVSAGAAFGCNYKSKQPGRVLRYNLAYCKDPRFCSFRSLIKTGNLFGAEFCYETIPKKLDIFDDDTFNTNPMEFYVVCTDTNTGKAEYFLCNKSDQKCFKIIRASASMPLVSKPVKIDDKYYLDGGISDSIPIKYFEEIGYKRNVAVLTRPIEYVKNQSKSLYIMRHALKKYPMIIKALEERHNIYNETLEYIKNLENDGSLFVIRPEKALDVGHIEHDTKKLQEAYNHGRAIMEKRLEELKIFLI